MILFSRIAFHSEAFVGFILKDLLQCLIASRITYLCTVKDIIYSVRRPSKKQKKAIPVVQSTNNVLSHEAIRAWHPYLLHSFCFVWDEDLREKWVPHPGCAYNELLHLHKMMLYVPVFTVIRKP